MSYASCEHWRTRAFGPRVAGGIQVYSVAGVQVYHVAGGVQVYSVTNCSTCCFLLHLQGCNYPKLYKGAEFGLDIPIQRTITTDRQTDRHTNNNCDLVIQVYCYHANTTVDKLNRFDKTKILTITIIRKTISRMKNKQIM